MYNCFRLDVQQHSLILTSHRRGPWTVIEYGHLAEHFARSDGIDHPSALDHVELTFFGHIQTTPCSSITIWHLNIIYNRFINDVGIRLKHLVIFSLDESINCIKAIRTRIAFPDDVRPSFEVFRVHDVHNLRNLVGVQVFQKLILAQRLFD